VHREDRTSRAVEQFHFIFHCVRDLPEALIAGREDVYLRHFFDKPAFNTAAIGPEDLEHYVTAYSRPGAMRCSLEVYRAFSRMRRRTGSGLGLMGSVGCLLFV
jgi:hypothetical protein